ncbi:type II toxin-antitoxin system RelE/ParE family toxin [Salinimicrobium xinjiangense]|uniref:type II toxin-antitoxin system RelE/ParE family toxin n=1 Tax=Salinimicrobium xinjiangense TaxID=438596 RepID=UPI00040211CF
MAFKPVLLPRAQNEISDAIDWYERREKGLGEYFLIELENELNRIVNNPLIFKETDGTHTKFRKAVLSKFPFIILFTLSGDDIIVHSVFHSSLNPYKKP